MDERSNIDRGLNTLTAITPSSLSKSARARGGGRLQHAAIHGDLALLDESLNDTTVDGIFYLVN